MPALITATAIAARKGKARNFYSLFLEKSESFELDVGQLDMRSALNFHNAVEPEIRQSNVIIEDANVWLSNNFKVVLVLDISKMSLVKFRMENVQVELFVL